MIIITLIAAFVALMYLKTKVNTNSSLDARLASHTPTKKTAYIGDTAEEIYSNFIKGEQFDRTGAKLLERKLK